jgi:ribosomal protein L37AE/L43A
MIEITAICPFCGSDAKRRMDRVKTKINGITRNLIPKKKWRCINCKQCFKNPASKEDFDYLELSDDEERNISGMKKEEVEEMTAEEFVKYMPCVEAKEDAVTEK